MYPQPESVEPTDSPVIFITDVGNVTFFKHVELSESGNGLSSCKDQTIPC